MTSFRQSRAQKSPQEKRAGKRRSLLHSPAPNASLGTARRNKTDLIFGGVVLALIYFAMCFNGGTSEVSFAVYPYDLLHNLGHGTGFFCGAIVALLIQIPMAAARRSAQAQR